MKYYLVEITTYTNGSPDAKGIYEYSTRDSAVASFHKKLGGAMDNVNYATELLTVIASNGSIVISEYYARPVAEPTPEPSENV